VYRVTIDRVSDKQLGPLVALIGTKRYTVKLTHYAHPSERKGKRQPEGDLMLSLTGKKAQSGTKRERALLSMERMEKRNGVGTVDRAALKKRCVDMDIDHQIVGQLISGGYIKEG